ncbi:MAG: HTTM domain-containing protein [Planctomycetaceae bacterium]
MAVAQQTQATEKKSFFFAKEAPYGLAIMRMVLPWTVMTNMLERWPWARELYSVDGAPAPLADNFGFPGFLPELPGSVVVALFTALTFFLVTSSIGWCTRVSLLAVTALYAYFGMLDCMSTVTKYTVIFGHLTLLLGLSACSEVWSVDSWLRRRKGFGPAGAGLDHLQFAIWPQRLMQLFLGCMYLGAALTKMHTPAFFSGDQLMYWMMTYINNVHPLGDWLSQYPLLLSVFGYITIGWETAFLFAVFHPRMKWWVLAVGAAFHIMTAFTLGLFIFPAVMLASYLCFLTEDEVRRILAWRVWSGAGQKLLEAPRDPALPPTTAGWGVQTAWLGTFALTTAALCVVAVEIEHRMDIYKQRGPDGPLALREMSPEEVEPMFNLDVPVRHSDKLLAFDLGTMSIGEHLLDRRREFRQGERIIAQVTLSPPHEDMWMDCVLTESKAVESEDGETEYVPGRLLFKAGQIVSREMFRSNFWFQLDGECEPGEYFLRLRTGNEEIARRRFTLLPKTTAPLTN